MIITKNHKKSQNHKITKKHGVMFYQVVISVQDEPGYNETIGMNFIQTVVDVLNSPKGWKKYNFILTKTDGFMQNADFIIELAPASKVKSICSTDTLSCWSPSHSKVLINYENWMGRSVISQETPPGLTLEEYRIYVINHEVGHALGMRHPFPKNPASIQCDISRAGKPGSVMMQMSKGTKFIYPCTPNCWPLDKEIYDEMQNKMQPVVPIDYASLKRNANSISYSTKLKIKVAVLIIIICIIFLIMMYQKFNKSEINNTVNITKI